ncbi:hypothetical protein BKI52_39340 [marine bacterium AO1-C]|nr:hypothetical protein BKI52_39340 [marine bacterium AO1-C]
MKTEVDSNYHNTGKLDCTNQVNKCTNRLINCYRPYRFYTMLQKKLFYPLVIVFLLGFVGTRQAKAQTKNYLFQAAYLINFTQSIEWPAENKEFIVGVLGSQYTSRSISRTFAQRRSKLGGRKVTVRRFPSISQIKGCNILFVSANSTNNIRRVLRKIQGKATLIVTEKEGFIGKGSCINFVVKNRRMLYEINPSQINNFGLTITNKRLVSYAVNKSSIQNATE